MEGSNLNPQVDEYIGKSKKWKEEYEILRKIILECDLKEEIKWNKPCYTFEKSNVVIIQGFKDYCALMFFKGVLLNDPKGILVKPGENSQVQRQLRFTNIQDIHAMESTLKVYLQKAIEVEKAGVEVNFVKKPEMTVPEELQKKFDEMPALKNAFESLTPGRQRAYMLYFSKAKKSQTRVERIEKYIEKILDGKGLND
ncbi:YdeI/OmpD-associated family protein [Gracilibacillus suaedae]|uniref:YdeI/OmpD-associated family protein n=1 Tax=Gracilibacillus suaedae TaxID=2820273 RepID=UPI001ABEA17C|nr:DUF1801 domain-containing protein [Gracilibacillus suaedae]